MSELARNADTGFLEASSSWAFTSDKKQSFLQLVREYIETFNEFPLTHAICKKVGINIRTFDRHLREDPVFKSEWTEIISVLKSVYTNKLAVKANSANGIVANLAILKYLETGSFVDRLQVINPTDAMSAHKRVNDAIIIDIDPETPHNSGKLGDNS